MPSFSRPEVKTVRVRVQEIGKNNKAVKTKTLSVFDTDAETEFLRIKAMYESELNSKYPSQDATATATTTEKEKKRGK